MVAAHRVGGPRQTGARLAGHHRRPRAVEQRDLYELPKDRAVILTERQAAGLAITAGRRLPTPADLDAAVRTVEEATWTSEQLWERFYDHRAAVHAADIRRVRAWGARLADVAPQRQPANYRAGHDTIVAQQPTLPVRVDEVFPLVRFLIGNFRDRGPGPRRYGWHTASCNRLDVTTTDGHHVTLTLDLMIRGGVAVHDPVTPFCPAETDYAADPDLALARSGQRRPTPMISAVFPVSPAQLAVWARPTPPAPATPALQQLGIALTFPGAQHFTAEPAWTGSSHHWERFTATTATGEPAPSTAAGSTSRIFVPDDINLMKTVHARIMERPGRPGT